MRLVDDVLLAQQCQQRDKRGMQLTRRAHHPVGAVAAWQVVAQELLHAAVVEHVHR
jgi:hypothetical protein